MGTKEEKNLELLSIFHYVLAGITALLFCIPFIHIFMGILMLTGVMNDSGTGKPTPQFLGWLFIVIGTVVILFGWTLASVIFMAGKKLRKRQKWLFCVVIAGIECAFMPLGTALGIFTLITLNSDSVRKMFNEKNTDNESISG